MTIVEHLIVFEQKLAPANRRNHRLFMVRQSAYFLLVILFAGCGSNPGPVEVVKNVLVGVWAAYKVERPNSTAEISEWAASGNVVFEESGVCSINIDYASHNQLNFIGTYSTKGAEIYFVANSGLTTGTDTYTVNGSELTLTYFGGDYLIRARRL